MQPTTAIELGLLCWKNIIKPVCHNSVRNSNYVPIRHIFCGGLKGHILAFCQSHVVRVVHPWSTPLRSVMLLVTLPWLSQRLVLVIPNAAGTVPWISDYRAIFVPTHLLDQTIISSVTSLSIPTNFSSSSSIWTSGLLHMADSNGNVKRLTALLLLISLKKCYFYVVI